MKWKHGIPRMGTHLGVTMHVYRGWVSPSSPLQSCHLSEWYVQWAKIHGWGDITSTGNNSCKEIFLQGRCSKTWCSLASVTARQSVTSQSSRSGQPALFHLGETAWLALVAVRDFTWNQRLKIVVDFQKLHVSPPPPTTTPYSHQSGFPTIYDQCNFPKRNQFSTGWIITSSKWACGPEGMSHDCTYIFTFFKESTF